MWFVPCIMYVGLYSPCSVLAAFSWWVFPWGTWTHATTTCAFSDLDSWFQVFMFAQECTSITVKLYYTLHHCLESGSQCISCHLHLFTMHLMHFVTCIESSSGDPNWVHQSTFRIFDTGDTVSCITLWTRFKNNCCQTLVTAITNTTQ